MLRRGEGGLRRALSVDGVLNGMVNLRAEGLGGGFRGHEGGDVECVGGLHRGPAVRCYVEEVRGGEGGGGGGGSHGEGGGGVGTSRVKTTYSSESELIYLLSILFSIV